MLKSKFFGNYCRETNPLGHSLPSHKFLFISPFCLLSLINEHIDGGTRCHTLPKKGHLKVFRASLLIIGVDCQAPCHFLLATPLLLVPPLTHLLILLCWHCPQLQKLDILSCVLPSWHRSQCTLMVLDAYSPRQQ